MAEADIGLIQGFRDGVGHNHEGSYFFQDQTPDGSIKQVS